ncbi:BTB/POZ domain-containing protein [Nymphaea thermarum]|nr:BTB/POZ domain-containing protein [Nymphaea thermarum]
MVRQKFPLVCRSGKVRRLLTEAKDSCFPRISLDRFPGRPEAFDLAAKFCYGINIEITQKNVAMLRCAAYYLEMTEEFAEKNLEDQTEKYLKEVVFPSIPNSIDVLQQCENLLPTAEDIKLTNRIINGIAASLCKEQLTTSLSRLEQNFHPKTTSSETDTSADRWGSSLTKLNINLFQRVISTLKFKGQNQNIIGKLLISYSKFSLQGGSLETELQKKQQLVVETIVGSLPTPSRKSSMSVAFLFGLLKAAITSSVSSTCRSDLERRVGLQLDQAVLEDILIPLNPSDSNSTLFDMEMVQRIVSNFLNLDDGQGDDDLVQAETDVYYELDSPRSPNQRSIFKVSKLMDSYLAEIATDANVTPTKFIAMAELLPDHARVQSDGLYKAIDLFLKAHPNIKESECYRLCKTIDCQKLSQDACSHAAQNERLPIQMAVQVLYFEQIRLRNALNGEGNHQHQHQFFSSADSHQNFHKLNCGVGSGTMSPRDNYASVRRENRELKMEVARMRMRLNDLEKDHISMKQELIRSNPASNMLSSFARKLSKLHALFRTKDGKSISSKKAHIDARFPFQKHWRHSMLMAWLLNNMHPTLPLEISPNITYSEFKIFTSHFFACYSFYQ